MIEIDGSYREGGGQILRTALSLSCLFRKPFRIYNIRKGRKKPGLMPQHLTAARAAQLLSAAQVTGDSIGSTELIFSPGATAGGDFFFDIGTAGSTSLVLQTLIPALAFVGLQAHSGKGSHGGTGDRLQERHTISLEGGTHVPFSPSFHYLAGIFVHFLKIIGIDMELSIRSFGFYPKGGGKVSATLHPVSQIKPLKAMQRGDLLRIKGVSGVANLPLSIAERQKKAFLNTIRSKTDDDWFPIEIGLLSAGAYGAGTFLYIEAEYENSVAGFTSLGERGKRAEVVGEETAAEFLRHHSTGAAIDQHMADQIVLYLSISHARSEFTTSCITDHLLTNLWAISWFHDFRYAVEGDVGKPGNVRIRSL